MNRAFFIVITPAIFVMLIYLAVGWRLSMPVVAGLCLLAVSGTVLLLRRRKGHSQAGR
jgi:predicted Kef-type K+ transport protein